MVELIGDITVVRREGASGAGGLGGVETRRDGEAPGRRAGAEGDVTGKASGIGASEDKGGRETCGGLREDCH